jgi:hypothetical protein
MCFVQTNVPATLLRFYLQKKLYCILSFLWTCLVAWASLARMWSPVFGLFGFLVSYVMLHRTLLEAASGQAYEERPNRPFPASHPNLARS